MRVVVRVHVVGGVHVVGSVCLWLPCPLVDGAMGVTTLMLMIVHDHSVLDVSLLLSVYAEIERPTCSRHFGSQRRKVRRRPSLQG
jgi:hypothetical protein